MANINGHFSALYKQAHDFFLLGAIKLKQPINYSVGSNVVQHSDKNKYGDYEHKNTLNTILFHIFVITGCIVIILTVNSFLRAKDYL